MTQSHGETLTQLQGTLYPGVQGDEQPFFIEENKVSTGIIIPPHYDEQIRKHIYSNIIVTGVVTKRYHKTGEPSKIVAHKIELTHNNHTLFDSTNP